MFYHVSPIPGLRELKPAVSGHEKPYVYAIDNLAAALLFGAPKDDFDILMDADELGKAVVWECYPNALERIYKGKACSVYTVSEEGFSRGLTGWAPEWVSESIVPVLEETHVADLYSRLMTEKSSGALIVHSYSRSADYRHFVEEELGERLTQWNLLEHFEKKDPRAKLYFQELIRRMKEKNNS